MEIESKRVFIEELNSEKLKIIERRMRPKGIFDRLSALLNPNASENIGISESGFLGPKESLIEIIKEDTETLKKLGVTHDQIGNKLNYLIDEYVGSIRSKNIGLARPYKEVLVDDFLEVSATIYKGYQDCPFKPGTDSKSCGYGSADIHIKNIRKNRGIEFSSLLPHLISDHHFFEGKETIYRLNPLEAVSVLEIASTKSQDEIDEMIFKDISIDLLSEDYRRTRSAIETANWFKEDQRLPKLIDMLLEKDFIKTDFGLYILPEIERLSENLPDFFKKIEIKEKCKRIAAHK